MDFRNDLRLRSCDRKIRQPELIALAHDDRAIDGILELTNVAGPFKLRKMRHRLAVDAGDGAVFLGAEASEEVPQKMWDVFPSRAQGRDRQRQHMQAVKQILAEMPAF